MPSELTAAQRELLTGPYLAVISTVDSTGRAVTVATWFLLVGDEISLSVDLNNARGDRLTHLRRDPRFTLTVLNGYDNADSVTIFATAQEFSPDIDLEGIDRMAQKHGLDKFQRRTPRVNIRATIDSVL